MMTESSPPNRIKTVTRVEPAWLGGTEWLEAMLPEDKEFFAPFNFFEPV
jgi:hypothetical protein